MLWLLEGIITYFYTYIIYKSEIYESSPAIYCIIMAHFFM